MTARPLDTAPGPIFAQPWWLDAVAPGRWTAVEETLDGRVVARWPLVVRPSRAGARLGGAPLTRYLGPWVEPGEGKPATRLSREHRSLEHLVERLPPFADLAQRADPSLTNALALRWHGFDVRWRVTYRLDGCDGHAGLDDLDGVWRAFRENVRREIRKAERQLTIRDDLGIDPVIDLAEKAFVRQGRGLPFDREIARRAHAAASARGRARTLVAVDADGAHHAGALVVWDPQTAYYLLGGGDADLRTSGAASLVLWDAVRGAAESSAAFDFCGSMQRPIERFFRAFGARQAPFLEISKTPSRALRAARALRDVLG